MANFLMRPEDELMHKPDASPNFNESVYTNGFNTASAVGERQHVRTHVVAR